MTKTPLRSLALMIGSIAFLATQPGAGCVSGSGGTTAGDDTSRPPSDADTNANDVPQRAAIVAEGHDVLGYTADADGQLYVQDLKDQTTVLSRRITRGQRVTVTPEANRITIDDDTASKTDLKRDHTHRIYLLRDRRFDDRRPDANANDDGLPSGAQVMGEGRNRELAFTPNRDGKVFIYDVAARRVVSSVDVARGKRFVFSPGADRATLDGKRVVAKDFDPTKNYRLYFAR